MRMRLIHVLILSHTKSFKETENMDHGGDLLTYKQHYDGELIDFSSNINPL